MCYLGDLAPGERRRLVLPCTAIFAGSFTGQASRAYPYYDDELVAYAEPVVVRIGP